MYIRKYNITEYEIFEPYELINCKDKDMLGSFSKINVFVGANNSGKSRFLRALMHDRSESLKLYSISDAFLLKKEIEEILKDLNYRAEYTIRESGSSINPIHAKYLRAITSNEPKKVKFDHSSSSIIKNEINEVFNSKNDLARFRALHQIIFDLELIISLSFPRKSTEELNTHGIINARLNMSNDYNQLTLRKLIGALKSMVNLRVMNKSVHSRHYIPILRTGHKLTDVSSDIYAKSVKTHYQINEKVLIHTGLNLHSEIVQYRNDVKDVRSRFEEFERFISDNFYQGKLFEIVARLGENNDVIVKIDKEEDRKIHNLGDGIQALILLLFPIFMSENNSWFFIEEPEINLHPGMQRLFLEQLLNNPIITQKNNRYFITTHSNHLLDLTLESEDISIFTFRKAYKDEEVKFEVHNVKSSDLDILDKLEVNNSSVFMANCSIWVEGISDRKYIIGFLEAYINEHNPKELFTEDIHFSFFEYAGSNITHYLFNTYETDETIKDEKIKAQFLNNRIFLIADKDEGKVKDEKHAKLLSQESENFSYYPLKCREIENILSAKEWRKYLPILTNRIRANNSNLSKIDRRSYKSKRMGDYLKSLFDNLPKGLSDGTLETRYKNKLADIVLKQSKWETMSDEAKDLAKSIFNFIKKHNS